MTKSKKIYATFDTKEDFLTYVSENVLSRLEACEFLDITKQSLSTLVKEGKVVPFKSIGKSTGKQDFFLKEDLIPYKEKLQQINKKKHPYKHNS